jgi:hypothetical protein
MAIGLDLVNVQEQYFHLLDAMQVRTAKDAGKRCCRPDIMLLRLSNPPTMTLPIINDANDSILATTGPQKITGAIVMLLSPEEQGLYYTRQCQESDQSLSA